MILLPLLVAALREADSLEGLIGDRLEDLWEGLSFGVALLGLTIRCITVGHVPSGTSGRNTRKQVAERLNTTGMYSIVRHPLYLGNFLILFGIAMFTQVWWFVLISALAFWIYYERIIIAEEEFLRRRFGETFLEWAERTPAFLPRFRNWCTPDLPFSLRTVLKREYSALLVITLSFFLIDVGGDLLVERRFEEGDMGWFAVFMAGLVIYITLRTLKKKTSLLDVPGR